MQEIFQKSIQLGNDYVETIPQLSQVINITKMLQQICVNGIEYVFNWTIY